jgi:hypothetical protein
LLRRKEAPRPQFENFVSRSAKQALGGPVHRDQAVLIDVVEQNRVGRLLDQHPEARVAGAWRIFGLPNRRRIGVGAGALDRRCRRSAGRPKRRGSGNRIRIGIGEIRAPEVGPAAVRRRARIGPGRGFRSSVSAVSAAGI